ncbi:MAG: hypothetical protein V1848_01700 [Candidatus Magasanikbacteria bacterium]
MSWPRGGGLLAIQGDAQMACIGLSVVSDVDGDPSDHSHSHSHSHRFPCELDGTFFVSSGDGQVLSDDLFLDCAVNVTDFEGQIIASIVEDFEIATIPGPINDFKKDSGRHGSVLFFVAQVSRLQNACKLFLKEQNNIS